MPYYPPGFDPSNATPGIYLAVTFGTSPQSGAAVPYRIVLYGNRIGADLTGSAPSFTVTAGTASNAVPIQVDSEATAILKFGQGSELHLGCKAVFDQWPQPNLWVCPVAEAGTKSSIVCTVTGTPTKAMSARLYVNGRPSAPAQIAVSDSVTTIATALAVAVLATPDLPVTAQFSAGVLTLTAKCSGVRGNQINVRVEITDGAQTLVTDGTTLARTLGGTTLTMSGGTGAGTPGIYKMSGAATADSLTNALAATLPERYHREVVANIDTTALQALRDQINTKAAIDSQLREQGIAATIDTYANAVTMAQTNLNAARMQLVWHYNADGSAMEIAAQVAAARLIGDGIVGGRNKGERTDAAANLNGCMLKSILQQFNPADRPTATQVKNALNNGLTPLVPAAANPGFTRIVLSSTTRSLDALSQPNYTVRKTKIVSTGDYASDIIQSEFGIAYAAAKLGSDKPGNPPPDQPDVVTPKMVRGHLFRLLKELEADAKLVNVDQFESSVTAIADPTTPGRVIFAAPPNVIPDFDQAVGELRPF